MIAVCRSAAANAGENTSGGGVDTSSAAEACDDAVPDEREKLLRRFDAFYHRLAWQRLQAVEHVWAISDIHVEVKANQAWLESLEDRPTDALIVAGDVTHSLDSLRVTLVTLVRKFKYVFFCVGNHELWHMRGDQERTADAIAKLLYIYHMVHSVGAFAAPALLGDPATGDGVALVGMQSWYQPHFLSLGHGPSLNLFREGNDRNMQMAMMMDGAVKWPDCLAQTPHGPDIRRAQFFADMNRGFLADIAPEVSAEGDASPLIRGWPVLTFSHFLPHPQLHRGYRVLEHIEGSLILGEQLKRLHAAAGTPTVAHHHHVHVFGHTHFSQEEYIDGVRYVQHPLGNPRERSNGWQIRTSERNPFALVWSRARTT
jgi:hypothetical protein